MGASKNYGNVTLPEVPCVYLIKADSGLWKIGRSTNVAGRFEKIRGQAWRHAGVETELFHIIECGDLKSSVDLETDLHNEFGEKRRVARGRTEWFELSERDVLHIVSIKRYNMDGAGAGSAGLLDRLAEALHRAGRMASRAMTAFALSLLAVATVWIAARFLA